LTSLFSALELSQALDVFTLSLALTSSALAILAAKGIDEIFKRRRETKKVKSGLVSYLSTLPSQISTLTSMFFGLSSTVWSVPLPVVAWPSFERMISVPHIDTAYYDTNVGDKLLYLPQPLANQALIIDGVVKQFNVYYDNLLESAHLAKSISELTKSPMSEHIQHYLNAYSQYHSKVAELGPQANANITGLVKAIVDERDLSIDWQPFLQKSLEMDPEYKAARDRFLKAIGK